MRAVVTTFLATLATVSLAQFFSMPDNITRVGGTIGGSSDTLTHESSPAYTASYKSPRPICWSRLSPAAKNTLTLELQKCVLFELDIQRPFQYRKPGERQNQPRPGFFETDTSADDYSDYSDLRRNNCFYINTTISQCIGGDKYLIQNNTIMIHIPGNNTLTHNTYISGVATNNGTFEYTTVLGAPSRIPQRRMFRTCTPDLNMLENAIRNGQSFICLLPVNTACQNCKGLGKTTRNTKELGGVICPQCKGQGKTNERLIHRVTW